MCLPAHAAIAHFKYLVYIPSSTWALGSWGLTHPGRLPICGRVRKLEGSSSLITPRGLPGPLPSVSVNKLGLDAMSAMSAIFSVCYTHSTTVPWVGGLGPRLHMELLLHTDTRSGPVTEWAVQRLIRSLPCSSYHLLPFFSQTLPVVETWRPHSVPIVLPYQARQSCHSLCSRLLCR
jgi:hypothetical protein